MIGKALLGHKTTNQPTNQFAKKTNVRYCTIDWLNVWIFFWSSSVWRSSWLISFNRQICGYEIFNLYRYSTCWKYYLAENHSDVQWNEHLKLSVQSAVAVKYTDYFSALGIDISYECPGYVRSPDGDTEYFDILAGVLQVDTLAPYLFIICLDYVLRTSIDKIRENGFELTKKRSRRYLAKTITNADYADDIALLANTPNQAETLLHSLERAATGIGLHVNAHKTGYMC